MLANPAPRRTTILYETRFPLLARERYAISLDPGLLRQARRELLTERGQEVPRDGSFRSGFLLGVDADPETHPACHELANVLHAQLLSDTERAYDLRFGFSFYKLGEGKPPDAEEGPLYEGPHLDSHPALTDSTELLRLLVNLSDHPRRFRYLRVDRWALAAQGISCGRRDFEPIQLPPGTGAQVTEIPGRTEGTLHALRFLASAVPHVGLNDPPEHFLVSFEALSDQGLSL